MSAPAPRPAAGAPGTVRATSGRWAGRGRGDTGASQHLPRRPAPKALLSPFHRRRNGLRAGET